jgi:hypothetical protein
MLELLGRFDLLGHDLGACVGLGKLHQLFGMLDSEALHVQLDEGGHGQP